MDAIILCILHILAVEVVAGVHRVELQSRAYQALESIETVKVGLDSRSFGCHFDRSCL